MKIRNLKLKNKFFLAPMLEPNDTAFRILCKKAGAALCYTGMINPLSKKKLILDDKPAVQIFCNSVNGVSGFIKKYDKKARLWDLNLGCPSDVAEKLGFGSYLKDIDVVEEILKTIRKATKKPLTIKIRKSVNAEKIIKIAEKYCDAVCIHPRTKEQGYSGKADLKFALKIKKMTKIPVIYSGDVDENNFEKLLKKFDYVMIGRKAIGNPLIFSKLTGKKLKKKIELSDYLKLAEKYCLPFRQVKMQAMWFTRGMKNSRSLRRKLALSKDIDGIKKILIYACMLLPGFEPGSQP